MRDIYKAEIWYNLYYDSMYNTLSKEKISLQKDLEKQGLFLVDIEEVHNGGPDNVKAVIAGSKNNLISYLKSLGYGEEEDIEYECNLEPYNIKNKVFSDIKYREDRKIDFWDWYDNVIYYSNRYLKGLEETDFSEYVIDDKEYTEYLNKKYKPLIESIIDDFSYYLKDDYLNTVYAIANGRYYTDSREVLYISKKDAEYYSKIYGLEICKAKVNIGSELYLEQLKDSKEPVFIFMNLDNEYLGEQIVNYLENKVPVDTVNELLNNPDRDDDYYCMILKQTDLKGNSKMYGVIKTSRGFKLENLDCDNIDITDSKNNKYYPCSLEVEVFISLFLDELKRKLYSKDIELGEIIKKRTDNSLFLVVKHKYKNKNQMPRDKLKSISLEIIKNTIENCASVEVKEDYGETKYIDMIGFVVTLSKEFIKDVHSEGDKNKRDVPNYWDNPNYNIPDELYLNKK